jgi:hypothetical protein
LTIVALAAKGVQAYKASREHHLGKRRLSRVRIFGALPVRVRPWLSKLAGKMIVELCNSLKRFEGVRANESGLPSYHEAYCDLRLYPQQRFMGTQILDLSSRLPRLVPACRGACRGSISTCLRQVEGETTRQESPWMQGPEGRPPNVSPARKGWETDPEDDERRRRGTKPAFLTETAHAVMMEPRTGNPGRDDKSKICVPMKRSCG